MFGNRMKVGNIEIASFDFTFTFVVALAWISAVEENRYIATGQRNFKGFKYGREIFIGIFNVDSSVFLSYAFIHNGIKACGTLGAKL